MLMQPPKLLKGWRFLLEIVDFIRRRFPENSNWLDGNCYYFAIILKDRFPQGTILYDVIDGHFVILIDNKIYDWQGIVSKDRNHRYVIWDQFDEYDELQKERIIRDCIL